MESAPIAKPDTPKEKKIENKEKTISITINNKVFTVEFKNEIEYLSVVAVYQDRLFPVKYTGKFSLSDIKKVGLFRDYESIDECLFEIFEGLSSNPTLTEKDSLNIIVIIPLHTRKYPEITFTLTKVEKNESQKYDELVNVLLNMKNEKDKEIKELKDKVEKLEKWLNLNNQNKEEIDEKFDGTKIEIFNIGKDEYLDYFPDKSQYNENLKVICVSIALECNEKDIKDVSDAFNKYKNDIKELFYLTDSDDLNMRINKNILYIDLVGFNEIEKENKTKKRIDFLFDELINSETFPLLIGFMTNGMKLNLKTKINLVDISEIKDEEKIDNLVYNTKIDFKGDIIICKTFLSLLIFFLHSLYNEDKEKKDKNDNNNNNDKDNDNDNMTKIVIDFMNDIFLNVINGKLSYSFNNKEILENFKEIEKYIFPIIKSTTIESVNIFKDPKYRIFQKINFNKIKVGILGSPKYNVGLLGINFESPKNNEFIDKVLEGKIILEDEEEENKESTKEEEKKD